MAIANPFMQGAPEATSTEVDSRDPIYDDLGIQQMDDYVRRAMQALYGDSFPLAKGTKVVDEDWVEWANDLWARHSAGKSAREHLVLRNRLFRRGTQWISALGLGPWREPPRPKEAARVVRNMIGPALDQRVQIISEQRPGFKTRPTNLDPIKLKKAEAQQAALEYQYDQQDMPTVIRELAYWAGTDGCSFGEVYWHPDRGPWDSGQPLGDLCTSVLRIEQVRVSANATASVEPHYWVIREEIPLAQAVAEYGSAIIDNLSHEHDPDVVPRPQPATRLGYAIPGIDENKLEQDTVRRTRIYCKKSEFLPQGITLVVVANKVAMIGPLLMGRVPIFRVTDGSSDPAFFPRAVMEDWIDSQMRINATLSKWTENIRLNSGPRLLAKVNTLVPETITAGNLSVMQVKGLGDVNANARFIEGFSLAPDASEYLDREIKTFEDLSGWNDVSRGQFSSEQSGRAILAIREQLERVFAPVVAATAAGISQWAKISLGWMAWGYDTPRQLGVMGTGRPDLARVVTQDDFDGTVDVWIDPETLMPMPRAMRQFLLDNLFQQGLMTPQEYRRRLPYALTRNLGSPDEDQEARARRVCEAIRQTGNPLALPINWQDNEAIHQDVLERELILPDDLDPIVKQAANARWMMLAQQSAFKMGGMGAPPAGGAPQGAKPQGSPSGIAMPADQQPMASTNPSTASADAATLTGPDENRLARSFDQMPH